MTDVFIDPSFDDLFRRSPLVLADVGARGGLKKNWREASRHLRVLGFEPDKREFDRLVAETAQTGEALRFFNVALSNARGPMPLYVARDRGLSSIFEPNRPFLDQFPDAGRFDTLDRVTVDADTLDHVLASNGVADVDFIKADTQGSELFVLQGARQILDASVVGVEVEAEFAPIYKDQPLFADVDGFLRGLGFQLFDVRPCYWKRQAGRAAGGPHGQIIWADALYLKGLDALQRSIAGLDTDGRRSKTLKAVSVAVLYGYQDYALEIVRATADLWSASERAVIERVLGVARSSAAASVPGRRRIAGALHRLWKYFRAPYDGWSVSDGDLGNRG